MTALFVMAIWALPAFAADPIFAVGSHIGLVPPPGMTAAKNFPGFEDTDKHAAIIVSALPAAAFAELAKSNATDALKKQGITVDKREEIQLPLGKALLLYGTQTKDAQTKLRKWVMVVGAQPFTIMVSAEAPLQSKTYTDAVMRATLNSLTIRPKVPAAELLSLLPFTVGDLAGYRIENIIPGQALILADAPPMPHLVATEGMPEYDLNARLLIAAMPGGPSNKEERPNYARMAFDSIGGIKDIQFTMSEPVRIDNQDSFETVARAKDVRTGGNIMVVQWLRFGNGGLLQIVGIAPADMWDDELTRLRTIRDSIHLR
jgi:hypothetical protein